MGREESKARALQYLEKNRDKVTEVAKAISAAIWHIRHYSLKNRFKIAMTILFMPIKTRVKEG